MGMPMGAPVVQGPGGPWFRRTSREARGFFGIRMQTLHILRSDPGLDPGFGHMNTRPFSGWFQHRHVGLCGGVMRRDL